MSRLIALIDDDQDDRMLFCLAFESVSPDIVCLTTENGSSLIESLQHHDIKLPDLIFIDINMPVKNGWYFLNIFQQHDELKTIPVIMSSTSSNDIDIKKAKHSGALFLFTKPDNFEELQSCVDIIYRSLVKGTLNRPEETSSPWFHYTT